MADTSFDILIIGGGPGGYVAAIRAMIRVNGLERLDDARLVRWPRPEA